MPSEGFDEYKDGICSLCNHNKSFHIFIKEMGIIICKVRTCDGCIRHVPKMMEYSPRILEQMK